MRETSILAAVSECKSARGNASTRETVRYVPRPMGARGDRSGAACCHHHRFSLAPARLGQPLRFCRSLWKTKGLRTFRRLLRVVEAPTVRITAPTRLYGRQFVRSGHAAPYDPEAPSATPSGPRSSDCSDGGKRPETATIQTTFWEENQKNMRQVPRYKATHRVDNTPSARTSCTVAPLQPCRGCP